MSNYIPRAKHTLSNEEACRNKKIERPRPKSALRTRRLWRRTARFARHTNSPNVGPNVEPNVEPNVGRNVGTLTCFSDSIDPCMFCQPCQLCNA